VQQQGGVIKGAPVKIERGKNHVENMMEVQHLRLFAALI